MCIFFYLDFYDFSNPKLKRFFQKDEPFNIRIKIFSLLKRYSFLGANKFGKMTEDMNRIIFRSFFFSSAWGGKSDIAATQQRLASSCKQLHKIFFMWHFGGRIMWMCVPVTVTVCACVRMCLCLCMPVFVFMCMWEKLVTPKRYQLPSPPFLLLVSLHTPYPRYHLSLLLFNKLRSKQKNPTLYHRVFFLLGAKL